MQLGGQEALTSPSEEPIKHGEDGYAGKALHAKEPEKESHDSRYADEHHVYHTYSFGDKTGSYASHE